MYLEIILTIIAVLLIVLILEIVKIRKLLQEGGTNVRIESVDKRTNDELYEEAKKIVANRNTISASTIQRKLDIGYARSSRLIDMLEDERIISELDENNIRTVLKKQ